MRKQNLSGLVLLCAVLGLATCTANRQTSPRLVSAVGQVPVYELKPLPALPVRSDVLELEVRLPEAWIELALKRARHNFSEGQHLFQAGYHEEARTKFRESLDGLRNSVYSLHTHPKIESEYFALFKEAQAYESQALLDLSDWPVPEWEPAPLDELAELNLFTIEVDPKLRNLVHADLLETRFDVPVVLNDSVLRFLDYFQKRGRRFMEQGLVRSGRYLPLFREVFQRHGVPLDLVYMAHIESNFNPHALSRARAKGIWQFMSGTGRLYGLHQDWWIDERSDILKSTDAAARFLRDLYDKFGDWSLAMAAYNVGPGRIERILNRHGRLDYWTMVRRGLLPRETANFVPSILASMIIFKNPKRYGFEVEPEDELAFETVSVKHQFDLKVIAESAQLSVEELIVRNPELTRAVTPGEGSGYYLKVPPGTAGHLQEVIASIPPEKRLRVRHHRVQRGETLSTIARRYSTSIQSIAQANRLANVNRLRVAQDLIIPLTPIAPSQSAARRGEAPRPTSSGIYTVRRGDTLSTIARSHRVRVADLLTWNGLRVNSVIYPGQKLRVSAASERAERLGASGTSLPGGEE